MTTDMLFRQAFIASPIGMAILDVEGRFRNVNPALARMLGRDASELQGRSIADFTHPDDSPAALGMIDRVAGGAVPDAQVQQRFLHPTGDNVWARVTVSRSLSGTDRVLIAQIEDVTETHRAKDLLQRRAMYDHLTGLANRQLLNDRLALALDNHAGRTTTVACVFLDVDHFKIVNDSLGHEAGDTMLVEIGRRIQNAVRPGDTVARLGGDEFVVVLENVRSRAAAEGVISLITSAVQAPVIVEGHEIVPTVSAGLALADPDSTAETLVRAADTAMFAAKQAGRARVEAYHPTMHREVMSKLSVEAELRTAIREGQLVVHYQPVVELTTRRVVAFEALVRWQHPSRGLLMPSEFIAISEEANLVVPLGSFVLHEACRFLASRPEFAGRVFVNVSTKQIGAADLARVVRSALAESGVEPARLGLEITESGMLMASHAATSDLESLQQLGVDMIIDDFGTGYSALSSVLLNPVAGLKLAREFTLRLGDRATGDRISTAMATLTSSLQMYGVIEGIETEAQYAIARQHGWTFGQGFLFGHATPSERLAFEPDGSVRILPEHSEYGPGTVLPGTFSSERTGAFGFSQDLGDDLDDKLARLL